MTRGKVIPPERHAELLHLYLTQGYAAASPLAIQYGVTPKAMSKWARKVGHVGKRGREPSVWKSDAPRKRKPWRAPFKARAIRPPDPRWQWAIERGAVVA
jgi:transposase-like protein